MKKSFLIIGTILICLCLWIFLHPYNRFSKDSSIFIRKQKAHFSIIIPQKDSLNEMQIARAFKTYLGKMGIRAIKIQQDTEIIKEQYISIGNTQFAQKLLNEFQNQAHKPGAFEIRSDHGNLFLLSDTEEGLSYSIYHLLEQYFNLDYFTPRLSRVPQIVDFELPLIRDFQNPSFQRRILFCKNAMDKEFRNFHKIQLPKSDSLKNPKTWYQVPSSENFQHKRCHGSDKEHIKNFCQKVSFDSKQMEDYIKYLAAVIKQYPEQKNWPIPPLQSLDPTYVNYKNKNSSLNYIYILSNKIANLFPQKKFSLFLRKLSRPPKLQLAKNLDILIPIHSPFDNEMKASNNTSLELKELLKQWSNSSKNLHAWIPITNLNHLIYPYPNISNFKEQLLFLKENKIRGICGQSIIQSDGPFSELKSYLLAKLYWNPNYNQDSLINKYLDFAFENAAPHIKEFISTFPIVQQNPQNYPDSLVYTPDYFSAEILDKFKTIKQQALVAATNNPSVKQRIKDFFLGLKYIELEIAKNQNNKTNQIFEFDQKSQNWKAKPYYNNLLSEFVKGCYAADFNYINSHGYTIQSYDNDMKILFENYSPLNQNGSPL